MMHLDLAKQANGQLNINLVLFLPLSLAHLGLSSQALRLPRSLGSSHPTPWVRPPNRRGSESLDRSNRREFPPDHFPAPSPKPPRRNHLKPDTDEEDEKENQPPPDQQEPPAGGPGDEWNTITQLLEKWGQYIDQLKDRISQDLDNYKEKLGIHH
uniref:E4 protein n=1 Tax=Human papillomavirus TaxID=10566 RepID=A0A385PJR6_9PAPI|nr:MAG: E4 protein [Human papillomavirus]